MGAAVDHGVDLAVLATGDDDRRLAEKAGFVVAGLRQFGGEAEALPSRPEKDAVEFGAVDLRVREHPVRHPRIAFLRPFERLLLHGDPPGRTPSSRLRLEYHGIRH